MLATRRYYHLFTINQFSLQSFESFVFEDAAPIGRPQRGWSSSKRSRPVQIWVVLSLITLWGGNFRLWNSKCGHWRLLHTLEPLVKPGANTVPTTNFIDLCGHRLQRAYGDDWWLSAGCELPWFCLLASAPKTRIKDTFDHCVSQSTLEAQHDSGCQLKQSAKEVVNFIPIGSRAH